MMDNWASIQVEAIGYICTLATGPKLCDGDDDDYDTLVKLSSLLKRCKR